MKRFVVIGVVILLLMFGVSVFASDSAIDIKADHISYSSCKNIIIAEGHVLLKRGVIRIEAARVKFVVSEQKVWAYAKNGSPLVFWWGSRKLNGKEAWYDFKKHIGVVKDATGEDYYTHFKGKEVIVEPRKNLKYSSIFLIGRKIHKAKTGELQERVKEGHFTTCENTENPQYEVVSKEIIILPGDLIIIKHPTFYLKGYPLFTYPFDYIIPLGKGGKKTQFAPSFGYTKDVGWYVVSEGTFFLGNMVGALWLRYGTEVGFGGRLSFEGYLDKKIHMFLYGGYTKDITGDKKRWRYGVYFSRNYKRFSWTIRYTVDENYEVVDEDGNEKKYVIQRTPEITFYFKPFHLGRSKWSVSALVDWGKFKDEGRSEDETRTKFAIGLSRKPIYFTKNLYMPLHFGFEKRWYSGSSNRFEVFETDVGLVWLISKKLTFSSYYVNRDVTGKSLLSFESVDPAKEVRTNLAYAYSDRFRFSFGAKYDILSSQWTNYYPSTSWVMGSKKYPWHFSISGDYDATNSSWNKINYSVYKDLPCKWRAVFIYKDDRTDSNDDELWLYFYLKPFPKARFGVYKGKDNYGIITGSTVTKIGGGEWW